MSFQLLTLFPFTEQEWFLITRCSCLSSAKVSGYHLRLRVHSDESAPTLHGVFMATCSSLCCRVKELKRAREHETPQKSPLAKWHHSPDSSLSFCLYLRQFTKEQNILKKGGKCWGKEKKNINASIAIITRAVLLLHVQQHFFPTHLFPRTWFWRKSGNFYRTTN